MNRSHTPSRRRLALACASLATAAVALTGCTTTVSGAANKDPGFKQGDPIPALLNPGNYPTKPRPPLGNAGANGPVIEGHRLGEFVVGPWEVDPSLIKGSAMSTSVMKNAKAFSLQVVDPGPEIIERHQFVSGFSSNRSSKEPFGQLKSLTNTVMEFPSADEANAAATELATMPFPDFEVSEPSRPFSVPGHPEAKSQTYKMPDKTAVVESYTPHGPFVFYNYASSQDGNPDVAGGLVTKFLDLQTPRIDQFKPTPPDKLADLPVDPTGLYARTLPPPEGQALVVNGTWSPTAALNFQVDPFLSKKLFDEGGVSTIALGDATVYEAKDRAGAQKLFDGFKAGEAGPGQKPAAGVQGFPSARCFDEGKTPTGGSSFTCNFVVDRYFVTMYANRDVDVQQKAAAQYLILTAK